MGNIKIIKTGINVNKILKQLQEFPDDWNSVRKIPGTNNVVDEYGFPEVDAGVLQLVIGGVRHKDEYVGDTEICVPTPAYEHHTEIVRFLKRNFHTHSRCGFLSLPVGGWVGQHVDVGSYYLTRDRYHLAIQGTYDYTVGGETVRVEPGTLIWFNNKLSHGTQNVGDVVRITFVFDVPHHKSNPK